jgi:folylpolyglutamate synthase/dihydropteroate synthase
MIGTEQSSDRLGSCSYPATALLSGDSALSHMQVPLNVPKARALLEKSGITMERLDALPVVHVSGTKGKGSTCAFVESILR